MKDWLAAWWEDSEFPIDMLDAIQWPITKPPAFLTIDDRALTFSGNWADYDPHKMKAFRPWMKK